MYESPDFGNDIEAARLYAVLCERPTAPPTGQAPTPSHMPQYRPATTAAEIARREGIDLDLSPVRHPASRRPLLPGRPGRKRPQPSAADLTLRIVRAHAPGLQRTAALKLAEQWVRCGCSLLELQLWIDALGLYAASAAGRCAERGVSLAALETVVDGMHVRRRLRGGESVDSVLALALALALATVHATVHGIHLTDQVPPQG